MSETGRQKKREREAKVGVPGKDWNLGEKADWREFRQKSDVKEKNPLNVITLNDTTQIGCDLSQMYLTKKWLKIETSFVLLLTWARNWLFNNFVCSCFRWFVRNSVVLKKMFI